MEPMTERYVQSRTPIATASTSGPRCTPQTDGTTPSTDAVQTALRTVLQTAARPLTPTQEKQLINTVTTLGARAAPAALLSVISICRQYLAEPQQQTAVLQTQPEPVALSSPSPGSSSALIAHVPPRSGPTLQSEPCSHVAISVL